MRAGRYEAAQQGMCMYCLAQARYQFDQDYVSSVETELALARQCLVQKRIAATEAVRIALLSKDYAARETRFKRIQYKPPKYREVLAAKGASESPSENGKESEGKTP